MLLLYISKLFGSFSEKLLVEKASATPTGKGGFMKVANDILELIGNTPLIRLNKMAKGLKADILLKHEAMNPGGSVKDRIGLNMITWAEKEGLLKPGGTIVEPTSGNTGVGLAMVAAIKGYRCIFVLPDKINEDKRSLLRAYGAEVIITPTDVPPDSPRHYVNVAKKLSQEIPGAYWPNQYNHPANKPSHIATTGPEIWRDTDGKVDVLVGSMGTCGTMSGTATFLKEKNPNLKVIVTDPEGSIFSGDTPKPYLVEGIGEDFLPRNLERGLIDEFIRISDKESFSTTRRLAREEGILAGGSSGTALAGAIRYAMRLSKPETIVVILPDTGRNYLSALYNDQWMQEKGMSDYATPKATVGEVLTTNRKQEIPPLVSVKTSDNIAEAIEKMHEFKISQLPVVDGNENVGSIHEDTLMRFLFESTDVAHQTIESVMATPMPSVDLDTNVTEAYRLFMSGANGVLVMDKGVPLSVLTRVDLVNHWATNKRS